MRGSKRKVPHWVGAVLIPAVVIAGCLFSCSCAIVRVAVEQGEGGLQADSTGIKAKAEADLTTDRLDVLGMPGSE